MTRRLAIACLLACAMAKAGTASAAEALRYEVQVFPDFKRHAALFAYPGYAAIALESIGLSPSLSSKLIVKDHGASVEIPYGSLRYAGRRGDVYLYEAALQAGEGGPRLAVPVTLDASGLASGKLLVTMRPPLASLIPAALDERIQVKIRMMTSAAAQKIALDYFDALARSAGAGDAPLIEAILLDSYNRSAGLRGGANADVGDALPLSDQWMLLLTLFIWVVAVPALYFLRLRRRRTTST